MDVSNGFSLAGSSNRPWNLVGLFLLASHLCGKAAAQSLLVILSLTALQALDSTVFVVSGTNVYFPSSAAHSDPDQESVVVTFGSGTTTWNWKMISGQTKRTGTVTLNHSGAAFNMVVNGATFQIYAITAGTPSGTIYFKEVTWSAIGPHASNDVASFQNSYIAWIDQMRGEGYPINLSLAGFLAFLRGIDTISPEELEGMGGTPGPSGGNPNGTSNGSVTIGPSGTTTTTVNGTTTVTTNNSATYNYNYNYDNSVTNNNTQDPIDLGPLTTAVNNVGSATTANGQKIDETNNKLDYLTDHVIDGNQALLDALNGLEVGGGGIPGPVTGIDPGTAPDVGTAVGSGITAGEGAASSKYGGVTGTMALSGQGNHAVTFAIPWVGGGSESYTINSLPESGSALDTFRLILRTFLAVLIGIGFIFMVVKTLRFY